MPRHDLFRRRCIRYVRVFGNRIEFGRLAEDGTLLRREKTLPVNHTLEHSVVLPTKRTSALALMQADERGETLVSAARVLEQHVPTARLGGDSCLPSGCLWCSQAAARSIFG